MKILSCLCAAFLLFAATASGATYYVDAANGSDSGSGLSTAGAWRSVSRVNRAELVPGDVVLFRRGCTWDEALRPPASGSSGSPIVFGAWGPPGDAVISGNGNRSLDTGSRNHLRFEQLCFRNRPVVIAGSGAVTLAACIIRNSSAEGIRIENSPGTAVLNCTVSLNRTEGILAVGSRTTATVRNSLIFGNGIDDFHYGIQAADGATLSWDHCLVSGNGYSAGLDVSRASGVHDGGGNLVREAPGVAGYAHGGGRFVISSDDYNVAYWKEMAAVLQPHGVRFTMFLPGAYLYGREAELTALTGAGHELALHGWSHADLTAETLFTIVTTNPSPSVTIDPSAKQIILTSSDTAKNVTISWETEPLTVQNLRDAVQSRGWTVVIAQYVNPLTRLCCLAGTGGPVNRFPFTGRADIHSPEYAFWRDELVRTAETVRERLGVTPVTLAYPFGFLNDGLREYIRSAGGILGARTTSTEWNTLSRIDVTRCAGLNFVLLKGDGSEARIRANARNAVVHAQQAGCIYVVYAHHDGEMTPVQLGWFVDEIRRHGGKFVTFREAMEEIRNGHTTRDGFVYTRDYPDRSDFHLAGGSPCIGAGAEVPLAFDYEGKPLAEGGRYDIGAIRYGDPAPVYSITASAGPGGSIDPSGTVSANPGDSREFRIIPDAGHRVLDVTADGVSVGAVSEYRFTDIREDHVIRASFAPIQVEPPIPGQVIAFGPWKEIGKKARGLGNFRIPVPANAFPASGGWFRISLAAGNLPLFVTGAFIGECAAGGDPFDMQAGTVRRITFQNGRDTVCVPGSGRLYSDWIQLPSGGSGHIISLGLAGSYSAWPRAGTGCWFRDFGAILAGTPDVSGYRHSHSIFALERLEVRDTPPPPEPVPDDDDDDDDCDDDDRLADKGDDEEKEKDGNQGEDREKEQKEKKDDDGGGREKPEKEDSGKEKEKKDKDDDEDEDDGEDDDDREGKDDEKGEKDGDDDEGRNGKNRGKGRAKLANFPNPFNAHTLISFTLAAESEIRISIFSISGQKVRELSAGRFGAGRHTLSWDARDDRGTTLSSGIYLVRLQTGTEVTTARMMYVK